MSFKILLILLFTLSSCGLKTRPKAPGGTTLPSIQDSYLVKDNTYSKEKKVQTKKKK